MATKSERIAEKVAEGMTHIDAQIAVAKEDAAATVKKLEAKKAREQKRIDAAAVEIIRREFPDVWAQAQDAAREDITGTRTAQEDAVPAVETEAETVETAVPDIAPTVLDTDDPYQEM